jgi:hypothetical protein
MSKKINRVIKKGIKVPKSAMMKLGEMDSLPYNKNIKKPVPESKVVTSMIEKRNKKVPKSITAKAKIVKRAKKVKKKRKSNAGRPTDYNKKYCNQIIRWMGQGNSITGFAGKIGVSKDTIYEWIKVHPEFSDSIKKGRAKTVKFLEQVGTLGMMGKIPNFNAAAWIFTMKNKLGWADKLTVDPEDSYTDEETDIVNKKETPVQTMKRLVEKYGKQFTGNGKR